jgi:hypothetical protein
MVSSGHSPRPPNEAPLKTSPEHTNKSEVTTWTGQLVRIEQTDFINNTIQIQKKKQEGHVHYKQNSYFGPFERERALGENFSMFCFFLFQVNLQNTADTL